MRQKIILGTRGSELARVQAHLVVDRLKARWPNLEVETKTIKTSGDDSKAVDLRAGRKGLFTGEIERALVASEVDIAVHSAKDLPSNLESRTDIAAVLPRGPIDDVLVLIEHRHLDSIPKNGIIATGSVRRKHQLHWQRPDLRIVDLRGNVPTRLQKLAREKWAAIILARAGLERLGLNVTKHTLAFAGNKFATEILPHDVFLPAGGQGVIALQTRIGDDDLNMVLEEIDDFDTQLCLQAEREFLRLLDADCNQPIGVLATVVRNEMKIRAQLFDAEMKPPRTGFVEGNAAVGKKLAAELLQRLRRKK